MGRWIDQDEASKLLDSLAEIVGEQEQSLVDDRHKAGFLDLDRINPRIIRKKSELEAIDPDTVLVYGYGVLGSAGSVLAQIRFPMMIQPDLLPAVVINSGSQFRVACQELKEQNND